MTAIRLGRERLTAVSNGLADLISDTCGSWPASPNGFLNGSVFGNDMGSLFCSHSGRSVNTRGTVQFRPPPRTLPRTMPRLQNAGCRSFAGTPANLNYLLWAVSCTFAFWTAALTAARNESLLAGACTLPDSVLRKETFLP